MKRTTKHWLQITREKYGIQQLEMAMFLNVSRSVVSLTEIYKRELPTKAMLKLTPLLMEDTVPLNDDIARKLESIVAEDEALTQKQIKRALRESEIKLIRAQRRLAAMQAQYQQVMNMLQLASRLKATLVENDSRGETVLFVESLVASAYAKLSYCGKSAQQPLLQTIKMNEFLVEYLSGNNTTS